MSNPVLSQLAAVEDDLSQQVESLEYKLTALQEQREGLRTVINMFQGSSQSSTRKVAASKAAASTRSVSAAAADSTTDSMTDSMADATADSITAATTGKSSTRKASANKPASSKKTGKKVSRSTGRQSAQSETVKATKPKAATPKAATPKTSTPKTSADTKADKKLALQKKKDGRAADWQKHVQPDYLEAALPEAVSIVLRSQPSEIFTIADVMSSIFTEDMPRPSYLKARNRISNILSAGARDGTWYRGRNGRYSQSENVKKIK